MKVMSLGHNIINTCILYFPTEDGRLSEARNHYGNNFIHFVDNLTFSHFHSFFSFMTFVTLSDSIFNS